MLGRSRAALLADLDAPRTTTDLAQRLDMTPGGVSQHLSVLKDSGFVTARRNGRAVLYCRSELADQLVTDGLTPPGARPVTIQVDDGPTTEPSSVTNSSSAS